MKYFIVRLYKFNNDVVYLNKSENKTGTIKEPYKYYYEPIVEYNDTLGRDIIISIDKKGIAREIVTDIEIPIIYKDEVISYNYDTFKYVKTFNNVIPPNGDVHTFSIISRTIYNDFKKIVYNAKQPTYEEVRQYLNINGKRLVELEQELEDIFKGNLKKVIEYKETIEIKEREQSKIKKIINQFKQK